jgi:hypothetical protein
MSSRLASSQSQLYLSLDKYKAAVAQLAGVATTRVAVLSFLADSPATSLVGGLGRRLASATPLPAAGAGTAAASGSGSSSSSSQGRALQQRSGSWSWELLPAEGDTMASAAAGLLPGDGGSSSGEGSGDGSMGLLAAAVSAAATGRVLLQSRAGQLEVYSRIATTSQADSDAIIGRINNATRQAEFEKALADAGLKLVPGSVAVRRAGQGSPGGPGWGLPGVNLSDPNTRRILIIVACSVGAALLVMLLSWWASCCVRRRRRQRRQAALQQQFLASSRPGGGTNGSNTPGGGGSSSNSSGSLRPVFGAPAGPAAPAAAGGAGRPLFNPFAAIAAQAQQRPSAYAAPPAAAVAAGVPAASGYTVAGRTFATAKEADDYQLALALSQSLREQQRQQHDLGGFVFGRYLPSGGGGAAQPYPPQQQQQQQQQSLSGYPPVGSQGRGGWS